MYAYIKCTGETIREKGGGELIFRSEASRDGLIPKTGPKLNLKPSQISVSFLSIFFFSSRHYPPPKAFHCILLMVLSAPSADRISLSPLAPPFSLTHKSSRFPYLRSAAGKNECREQKSTRSNYFMYAMRISADCQLNPFTHAQSFSYYIRACARIHVKL